MSTNDSAIVSIRSEFTSRLVFLGAMFAIGVIACTDKETQPLHTSFNIDTHELNVLISDLPASIRAGISERPWYFLELVDRVIREPDEYFILADKQHALPQTYEPPDLIRLTKYNLRLNRRDLSVRRSIMPDLLAMVETARIANIELLISSAYRSYDYQASVYRRAVARDGKEQADRESAQPGKSQHQLGTTLDFGSITDAFADTKAGKWLKKHAWEFGFSLSYPEGYETLTGYRHEIWHYRYITRAGTLLEHEFFNSIQYYMLTFLHDNRKVLNSHRPSSPE